MKGKIMKKIYNQPAIMISEIMPTTIICASITQGAPVDPSNPGDPPEYGD